jgi:hypothetical protein
MSTPTISPSPAAGNNPSGPYTPTAHTHPYTAITGLRFGADGRVEPVYDAINVRANGQLIALYNAAATPGSPAAAAVPFVTVDVAVQNNDGEDTKQGKAQADAFLAAGKITQKQYDDLTKEIKPSTAGVGPARVNTTGKNGFTFTGDTFEYSTVLTPNGTTLGDMIKKVSFPRTIQQLGQGYPGMTAAQIVTNLSALAVNVLEPVKKKYPMAFMTNSFRHGASIGGGQHGTGQACDIQFSGVKAHDYYEIILWMSKNIPYGQLLLEYLPNKTVWAHVSYEIPGLPAGGISVKPANKLATLNGAAGGKFLPNLHQDILVAAVPNRVVGYAPPGVATA